VALKVRLLDEFIEVRRYWFHQGQRRQCREDHLTVARGLTLFAVADRAVGPVQLREQEIMTE
jgi:hypothetical protein